MRSDSLRREHSRQARLLSTTARKHSRQLRLAAYYLGEHDRRAQPARTRVSLNTTNSPRDKSRS